MTTTDALQRLFTSYGNAMYRYDPDAAEKIAAKFSAALVQQPAASGEPVAWRITQGARVFYVSADEFRSSSYDYGEMVPLYTAQPAPAPAEPPTFDAEGFRAFVLRELPDDTIIGKGAWWADHLTKCVQWFVKPAAQPAPARVPLTDEQVCALVLSVVYEGDASTPHRAAWAAEIGLPFARAIEAAHGITAQGEPK